MSTIIGSALLVFIVWRMYIKLRTRYRNRKLIDHRYEEMKKEKQKQEDNDNFTWYL